MPIAVAAPPPEAGLPLDDTRAMAHLREQMATRIMRLVPAAGLHEPAGLPALRVVRNDTLNGSICGTYEPGVALIVQGRKRVAIGGESLIYDHRHFLLASLDLPATATILEATPERPYLALVLRLDLAEIATLMMNGPVPRTEAAGEGAGARAELAGERAIATGLLTVPLLDAFHRLLALLEQPADLPVLGPLVQREIHYRLLVGEQGHRLRRIAATGGHGHQIARAIERLKAGYTEPLRVEALARELRMSVSTFHHRFKAYTALSPLQFQKHLRLNEARRLMLAEDLDASTAAYRVGYESASQFSREYSRRFGAPPMRDIEAMRGLVQQQAAREA